VLFPGAGGPRPTTRLRRETRDSRYRIGVRMIRLGLGLCACLCIGCGAGATVPDAGDIPSAIILTGAWSGTVARAPGLNPIAVSWVDKPGASFSATNLTFSGPVTLAHLNDTLSGTLGLTLGGTSTSPTLSLNLEVDPGDAASTLKSCSVTASAVRAATITNTSLVATVSISFAGCPSLVNGRSSATETDLLTLQKLYVSRP